MLFDLNFITNVKNIKKLHKINRSLPLLAEKSLFSTFYSLKRFIDTLNTLVKSFKEKMIINLKLKKKSTGVNFRR